MKRTLRPAGAPKIFFHTAPALADHLTLENYVIGTLAVIRIDNCLFPFELRRTSDEAPVATFAAPKTVIAFKSTDTQDGWTLLASLPPFAP